MARNVDRHRVLVADVHGEGLTALSVEDDNARRPSETDEEVVLASPVEVQPPNHASPGEGDIRLHGRLRKQAVAPDLDEPAALVREDPQRKEKDPRDHACLFAPVSSMSVPMRPSASCVPASRHHPLIRAVRSRPCSAYQRLTSVISSSPREDGARPRMISKTSGG